MQFAKRKYTKHILFFLITTTEIFNLQATEDARVHRFATYNIRYGNASDTGEKAWINRKSYVMQIIRDYDFDIAGLQEVTGTTAYNQLQDLQTTLTEYNFIPYERSGTGDYSYNVVIYKKTKYECIEHGCFWISSTPEKPSIGWDAELLRTVVWSKMRDLSTNEIFYFCATHTDGGGKIEGRKGAKLITDRLKKIVGDYPMVLVGDFNHRRTDGVNTYRGYASNFYDSYHIANASSCIPKGNITITAHNWYPADNSNISGSEFDYIFCDNVQVFNRYIITEDYNRSVTPSDHFPVLITCKLLGQTPKKSIYVNHSVAISGDGTLDSPYATIDEALEKASIRDTIKVTCGKYIPVLKIEPRTSCYIPKTSIVMIGGYNDDFSKITGKTVIDGDLNQDDTSGNYSDNLYQLISIPKYYNLTLKNFILENAHSEGLLNGAGLYTEGFELNVENVEFNNNYAVNSGGALYSSCEYVNINDCIFCGNKTDYNGGAAKITVLSDVTLNRSHFKSNEAIGGSALCLTQCENSYFQNNTFENNISTKCGSIYLMNDSNVISHNFLNNTFANNQLSCSSGLPAIVQTYGGAAIYAKMYDADSKFNLAHTTISGNQSNYIGSNTTIFKGSAINIYGGTAVLMNNLIAGNFGTNANGDLCTDGKTIIGKETYNLFTSPENVNFVFNTTDITATDYSSGIKALATTLDGYIEAGKFIANVKVNGGATPTVGIINPIFNNQAVNCLSANLRLVENSFQIDLNGDGSTIGYIKCDQRNIARQFKSCIGAFEYIAGESGTNNISTVDGNMRIYRTGSSKYTISNIAQNGTIAIYDSLGRCVYHLYNKEENVEIDISAWKSGVYILSINNRNYKIIQ